MREGGTLFARTSEGVPYESKLQIVPPTPSSLVLLDKRSADRRRVMAYVSWRDERAVGCRCIREEEVGCSCLTTLLKNLLQRKEEVSLSFDEPGQSGRSVCGLDIRECLSFLSSFFFSFAPLLSRNRL